MNNGLQPDEHEIWFSYVTKSGDATNKSIKQ